MALASRKKGSDSEPMAAETAGRPVGAVGGAPDPELAALLARLDGLIDNDDVAAVALAKSAAQQFPGDPLVKVRLARLAMHTGDAETALRYAVDSAKAAPDSAAVIARSSAILKELGYIAEAFSQLSGIVADGELVDEFVSTAQHLGGAEIGPEETLGLHRSISALTNQWTGAPDGRSLTVARLTAELADKIQFEEAAARLRVYGHIDYADPVTVAGWVIDASDPARRCEIEVVSSEGEVIARGHADQLREDLRQAGFSHGEYGFRIHLPFKATLSCASAFVRDALTQASLGALPLPRFVAALDPACLNPENSHVTGWCIDREHHRLRPKLSGICDDRKFSIGTASLYRRDLRDAGFGDGFHGFEFPKRVLPGPSTFSVVEARTGSVVVRDAQLKAATGQ